MMDDVLNEDEKLIAARYAPPQRDWTNFEIESAFHYQAMMCGIDPDHATPREMRVIFGRVFS